MNDDIKRALEAIYGVKENTITELTPAAEPRGAQAAAAHMGADTKMAGTFNPKTFAGLIGMDSSEGSLLVSFLNKHKQGMPPNRNELLAAADAFRALVDADPQVTNQAMTMLRRVHAQTEESVEQEVAESIRITKEGVEECWSDMMPNAATGQGEQMTVNISMPNKQISVTTDSADEIMNVLKLAGIAVGEPAAEPEAPVVTMMPIAGGEEPEAAMVGAPGVTAPEEESGEEESEEEEKKEESVEPQGPAVEEQDAFTMAAAAAAREGKTEFEFPQGSGKMHPVKIGKDTAHKMGEGEEVVDEAAGDDVYDQVRAMAKDYYGKEENKPSFSQKDPSFMDKIKARVDRGVAAYKAAQQANQQAGRQTESEETNEGQEESARILKLAGLDEAKFANAPANTEGEAKVYDKLPSAPGDGGGKPEYGTRQSNLGGENPMALKTLDIDMEESFQVAMGEYRKFVAENIMRKEGVTKK